MTSIPRDIPADLWNRRQRWQTSKGNDVPEVEGQRFYSFIPVMCESCGRERWLKTNDARKALKNNLHCRSCHCHIIGKKGYAVAIKNGWSHRKLLNHIRQSQLDKPSSYEVAALEIMQEVLPGGFEVEQQVIFDDKYIIDFVISYQGDPMLMIEIMGYWHKHNIKQCLRDRALKMTSVIPVEFVDEMALFGEGNHNLFADMIYRYVNDYQPASNEEVNYGIHHIF